jgi:hypothetical protein
MPDIEDLSLVRVEAVKAAAQAAAASSTNAGAISEPAEATNEAGPRRDEPREPPAGLPPALGGEVDEIRRAVEALQSVINGWEVWLLAAGQWIVTLPDYGTTTYTPPAVILWMGQGTQFGEAAELAVRTLYGHNCLPPSFRGRRLEDALTIFPSPPRGAISSDRDKAFVSSVRQIMPELRTLDAELQRLLDQLSFSPLAALRTIRSEDRRSTVTPPSNGDNEAKLRIDNAKAKKGTGELKSWTQSDLNNAIREYKARRASTYKDLVEGVKAGRPGAINAARKLFGRNAVARALLVKARAMVTYSAVWQAIACELQLVKTRGERGIRKDQRIGEGIAQEQKAEAAGDPTQEAVLRDEAIRLARQRLPAREANAIIKALEHGAIGVSKAHELIDVTVAQQKEKRSRKADPSP